MAEEITDNEFYVVVFTEEYGTLAHVFVHLRNGENIFNYMRRVHGVDVKQIDQIYRRTYIKQ